MENKIIPVIGTAVVNNIHWIKRLVQSVDYPTEKFIIIDNNGRGQLIEELDNLSRTPHPFIKKIIVSHMPANMGCSGAWNLIIKSNIMSPYWIIANDDIAFTPGFLEKMISLSEDPEVGIVHGDAGDFGGGSWCLFLIKDWVIKKFGLFDENFYPIYCEDADYIMRLHNSPIKRIYSVGINYLHGEGTNETYYETGQQTKKGEKNLEEIFNNANLINFEYMNKKWGKGWRYTAPYKYPFDNPSMPLSITTYDLDFVRKKYTGF